MKIALIGPGIYPFSPTTGGARIGLFYIGRKLALRHEVIIVAPRPQRELIKKYNLGRAHVFLVKQLKRPWSSFLFIVLAPFLTITHRVNVINAHQALGPMVAATLSAIIAQKPLVITCHGSDIRILGRKNRWIYVIQKICLNRAKAVVCVSKEIQIIITRMYGISADKVLIIRNGYDERLINTIQHSQSFREAPMVSFLGSLRPAKDPLTLLKALKKLYEKGLRIRCNIIGDGPLRPHLEAFCNANNLHKLVIFYGQLPHEQALRVAASSPILVFPSIQEGLPVALIEAMALGRAIVATRVGGIPELVKDGENGLLVRPKDPEALASAIGKLISDKALLKRLSKNAQMSVKGLSWSKICDAYERLYYKVLGLL